MSTYAVRTCVILLYACTYCCRYRLLLTRAPRTAYARDLTRRTLPQGVEMGVSTSGVSVIQWVVLGFCTWSPCSSFICLVYSVHVCDRMRGLLLCLTQLLEMKPFGFHEYSESVSSQQYKWIKIYRLYMYSVFIDSVSCPSSSHSLLFMHECLCTL